MGYKPFGKYKTIVLPIDSADGYTIAQYKEKFGIDLKEIIELTGPEIRLKKLNALVLVQDFYNTTAPGVIIAPEISSEPYTSGSSDAKLFLCDHNANLGLCFVCSQSDDFNIENVKVYQVIY